MAEQITYDAVRGGGHPRRHHHRCAGVPRGAQAGGEADDRFRGGDRGEDVQRATDGALPAGPVDRAAGLRGGEFSASADRAVHQRGADAWDAG